LLIAGAFKEPHLTNESAQRRTWGRDFQVPVYWCHGNANGGGSGEVAVGDLGARRINVELEENHSNLHEKTLQSLTWALKNYDFDFAVRSNTSSFWNEVELLRLLERLPRSGLYAGPIGTWSEPGDEWDYIGGSALFMSRDIAELACRADVRVYRHLPDDVAFGHWMRENGVDPAPLVGSRPSGYEPVAPASFSRLKHWSDARITRSRMTRLDRVYRSQGPLGALAALTYFNTWEIFNVAFDPSVPRHKAGRLIVRNLASWSDQARKFTARLS